MKNIFLLFTLILTAGCAQEKLTKVNPVFHPYVKKFVGYSRQMGSPVVIDNLTIEFDDSLSGTNTLGVCAYGGMEAPAVRINTEFWNSSYVSNSSREQLIFHELGHCVLNRGHKDGYQKSADSSLYVPMSMMNPYHLQRQYYEGNHMGYIAELFSGQTPTLLYALAATTFPAADYASTLASNRVEYKTTADNLSASGLSEEDYADLSNFGCGAE